MSVVFDEDDLATYLKHGLARLAQLPRGHQQVHPQRQGDRVRRRGQGRGASWPPPSSSTSRTPASIPATRPWSCRRRRPTSRPCGGSGRPAARSPPPCASPARSTSSSSPRTTTIKVIECNLRASRSFPFVSKVSQVNFVDLAVESMMGKTPKVVRSTLDLNYVGVKAPQFSFSRLHGRRSDPGRGDGFDRRGRLPGRGRLGGLPQVAPFGRLHPAAELHPAEHRGPGGQAEIPPRRRGAPRDSG